MVNPIIIILSSCVLLSLIGGGIFWYMNQSKNYYIDQDDEKQEIELKDQELKGVKKLVLNPSDLEDTKKIKLLYTEMEFVEKEEPFEKEFDNPIDITMKIVEKTLEETCQTGYKYDSSSKQCEVDPDSCTTGYKYNNNVKQCEIDLKSIGTLVGHYTADSFDETNKLWKDISGNGKDGTVTGTVTKAGNLVQGMKPSKVVFPSGLVPSTYTLFAISKYNGDNRKRIFNGYPQNWLFGHWGGKSGVAFYTKWMTQKTNSIHDDNLVLSSGTNNLYRSNGTQRSTETGGTAPDILSINGGLYTPNESSDWAVGEIIVYDGELDEDKIKIVEEYLAKKYGITLESTTEGFTNISYNKNYSML